MLHAYNCLNAASSLFTFLIYISIYLYVAQPLMTSTPSRPAPAPASVVDPRPITKPGYTNGYNAVKVPAAAAAAAEPLLAADEELMTLGPKRPSATKSTNGPPVYYPPDPMFTKKDAPILVISLRPDSNN
jgi:hypothetical protein